METNAYIKERWMAERECKSENKKNEKAEKKIKKTVKER